MRSLAVIATVCLVVSFESLQANGFWRLPFRRFRFRIPRKPATTKAPTTMTAAPVSYLAATNPLPLCAGELDVAKILREAAAKGRAKRETTSWPYDCTYPSIVNSQGKYDFITAIYSCCDACKHPTFTNCVSTNPSPYWKCPASGMHCIVNCVTKNNPNKQISVVKPAVGGFVPLGGKQVPTIGGKRECTKTVTQNGKKCIKQLCVQLRTV